MTGIGTKIFDWLDRIVIWPVLMYRKYKYGYPYRRIYLGNRKWAIVDPDDYYRLAGLKWCAIGQKGTFYAVTGIQVSPQEIKLIGMHRLIMNAPDGVLVDHKNCLSLDNRKDNLRFATHSQNAFNRPKKKIKNASSKFIGVSFNKARGKWSAKIWCQYKQIWLGYFTSEIDAARAYDRAAIKYHTSFAKLNFPKEIERSPKCLNLRNAAESRFSGRGASQIGLGPG